MDFNQLDSYESPVRTIARKLAPQPQCVDVLGNDRDDYEADLMMLSWNAQLSFRDRHGFSSPAERRYVCKSLWNAARERSRHRSFRLRQHETVFFPEIPATTEKADLDDQLEAREAVAILERRLGSDFSMLVRLAETNGNLSAAYDESRDQVSYQTFRRQMKQLRERACKILD